MIEKIIERLANNSFHIKTWAVTFVSGIIALTVKTVNTDMLMHMKLPILFFWSLDAYYLYLERYYRRLYRVVLKKDEKDIDFSMEIFVDDDERCWLMQKLADILSYAVAFISSSEVLLYMGLEVAVCIISRYFNSGVCANV